VLNDADEKFVRTARLVRSDQHVIKVDTGIDLCPGGATYSVTCRYSSGSADGRRAT
jgi:hypothetical protein